MNRIVIEFCPEDRQRIDELISFAGLLVGELKSRQAPNVEQPVLPEHPADVPTAPWDLPAPEPDPAFAAPAPAPVSLGEFQKAIVTRCAESVSTKEKVQALVHKYAESVSAIPEEKRPEVLAALAQI